MVRSTIATVAVLFVGVAACSGSGADDALEEQLDAVTAERDALLEADARQQRRHDRSLATLEEVNSMLDDPESFGSDEDVVAAIARHSTDTAVMDDAVFGTTDYRQGFYNTLSGGDVDARLDTFESWVSEDGSQGATLWIWYGTNVAGNPFELVGLSRHEFAEDGRISYELVTYPYSDEYVRAAFEGDGTATPATGGDR